VGRSGTSVGSGGSVGLVIGSTASFARSVTFWTISTPAVAAPPQSRTATARMTAISGALLFLGGRGGGPYPG
jgi:hypothetical protein